jgi:hypothetical protein
MLYPGGQLFGGHAMDSAFANALKRLEELKLIIEVSKREMSEIELYLTLHKRFSKTNPELEPVDKSDKSPVGIPSHGGAKLPVADFNAQEYAAGKAAVREHRRGNPALIVAMAQDILTINKSPMTRGEIADEIERRGTSLPGSDRAEKAKYVGTILWRNSEIFENQEGRGYWLVGQSLPATAQNILSGAVTAGDILREVHKNQK